MRHLGIYEQQPMSRLQLFISASRLLGCQDRSILMLKLGFIRPPPLCALWRLRTCGCPWKGFTDVLLATAGSLRAASPRVVASPGTVYQGLAHPQHTFPASQESSRCLILASNVQKMGFPQWLFLEVGQSFSTSMKFSRRSIYRASFLCTSLGQLKSLPHFPKDLKIV